MSDQEITFSPPMSVDTSAFALLADLQYHEPFASEALNRKFYGIIPPGIYRGFQYVLPGGMTLRIGRPSEAGSAIIHVGDRCITIQQYKPVDLVVAAGFVGRVVLEGFYQLGVKTKQVDSASTIDAVSIKLVTEAQYKPDHVTLYNLNVPTNATAMQASYISDAKRNDVDIAVDSSIYQDLAAHIASPTAHAPSQVGLGSVNNWPATAAVDDASDAKYATAGAVKKAYDLAASKLDTGANAVSASKWAVARTITLTGGATGAVSIDGSANVSLAVTVAPTGHTHTPSQVGLGSVNNWPATAAVDDVSDAKYATAGAVKKAYDLAASKLDTGANAVSATKLATARTIGGVGFDGTANINLPGVNTAGNQSTSGNAATATKLATARTINGSNFDGSAAITTANWGTARTLTIGSTGKSVNGAGNVAWSLAEIGAAAASHSHPWSQVTGVPATATRWPTWGEVTGKPSTIAPSAHTHPAAQGNADIVAGGYGQVGTYGFFFTKASGIYRPGHALSGGSLLWSSVDLSQGDAGGGSPAGTWKLLGYYSSGAWTKGLWIRIA